MQFLTNPLPIIKLKKKIQMENVYNELFIARQKSLQFAISEHDEQSGSRIGGYAPAYFDDEKIAEHDLQEYVYYISIGADLLPNILGSEISIFSLKILGHTIEIVHIHIFL